MTYMCARTVCAMSGVLVLHSVQTLTRMGRGVVESVRKAVGQRQKSETERLRGRRRGRFRGRLKRTPGSRDRKWRVATGGLCTSPLHGCVRLLAEAGAANARWLPTTGAAARGMPRCCSISASRRWACHGSRARCSGTTAGGFLSAAPRCTFPQSGEWKDGGGRPR